MRMTMKFNINDFQNKIQGTIGTVGFGSSEIVKEEAEEIMEASKKMCPVDTGALVDSAFVEQSRAGLVPTYTFGYSGNTMNPKTGEFTSAYAVKVHEDLSVYHKNGEAKFLEKAVLEHALKRQAKLTKKLSWLFRR